MSFDFAAYHATQRATPGGRVARRVVRALRSEIMGVFDGEEVIRIAEMKTENSILDNLMAADYGILLTKRGSVALVWGEDAEDTITDYDTRLESTLAPIFSSY